MPCTKKIHGFTLVVYLICAQFCGYLNIDFFKNTKFQFYCSRAFIILETLPNDNISAPTNPAVPPTSLLGNSYFCGWVVKNSQARRISGILSDSCWNYRAIGPCIGAWRSHRACARSGLIYAKLDLIKSCLFVTQFPRKRNLVESTVTFSWSQCITYCLCQVFVCETLSNTTGRRLPNLAMPKRRYYSDPCADRFSHLFYWHGC